MQKLALALRVSSNLTTSQYSMIRKSAVAKGIKLYPSYHMIKLAKKLCYPSECDIFVSESLVEIQLQSVLDLTIQRFFLTPNFIDINFLVEDQVEESGL